MLLPLLRSRWLGWDGLDWAGNRHTRRKEGRKEGRIQTSKHATAGGAADDEAGAAAARESMYIAIASIRVLKVHVHRLVVSKLKAETIFGKRSNLLSKVSSLVMDIIQNVNSFGAVSGHPGFKVLQNEACLVLTGGLSIYPSVVHARMHIACQRIHATIAHVVASASVVVVRARSKCLVHTSQGLSNRPTDRPTKASSVSACPQSPASL